MAIARETVELYEKQLNRLSRQNLEEFEKAYRAGEVGTLDVFRTQEDYERVTSALRNPNCRHVNEATKESRQQREGQIHSCDDRPRGWRIRTWCQPDIGESRASSRAARIFIQQPIAFSRNDLVSILQKDLCEIVIFTSQDQGE